LFTQTQSRFSECESTAHSPSSINVSRTHFWEPRPNLDLTATSLPHPYPAVQRLARKTTPEPYPTPPTARPSRAPWMETSRTRLSMSSAMRKTTPAASPKSRRTSSTLLSSSCLMLRTRSVSAAAIRRVEFKEP